MKRVMVSKRNSLENHANIVPVSLHVRWQEITDILKRNFPRKLTDKRTQKPNFRLRVKLNQYRRSRDDKDQNVRDTEINQENVGGISEFFGLEDDVGHECIPCDSNHKKEYTDRCGHTSHVKRKSEVT